MNAVMLPGDKGAEKQPPRRTEFDRSARDGGISSGASKGTDPVPNQGLAISDDS